MERSTLCSSSMILGDIEFCPGEGGISIIIDKWCLLTFVFVYTALAFFRKPTTRSPFNKKNSFQHLPLSHGGWVSRNLASLGARALAHQPKDGRLQVLLMAAQGTSKVKSADPGHSQRFLEILTVHPQRQRQWFLVMLPHVQ